MLEAIDSVVNVVIDNSFMNIGNRQIHYAWRYRNGYLMFINTLGIKFVWMRGCC